MFTAPPPHRIRSTLGQQRGKGRVVGIPDSDFALLVCATSLGPEFHKGPVLHLMLCLCTFSKFLILNRGPRFK